MVFYIPAIFDNFRCASSKRVMEYYNSFAKDQGNKVNKI